MKVLATKVKEGLIVLIVVMTMRRIVIVIMTMRMIVIVLAIAIVIVTSEQKEGIVGNGLGGNVGSGGNSDGIGGKVDTDYVDVCFRFRFP